MPLKPAFTIWQNVDSCQGLPDAIVLQGASKVFGWPAPTSCGYHNLFAAQDCCYARLSSLGVAFGSLGVMNIEDPDSSNSHTRFCALELSSTDLNVTNLWVLDGGACFHQMQCKHGMLRIFNNSCIGEPVEQFGLNVGRTPYASRLLNNFTAHVTMLNTNQITWTTSRHLLGRSTLQVPALILFGYCIYSSLYNFGVSVYNVGYRGKRGIWRWLRLLINLFLIVLNSLKLMYLLGDFLHWHYIYPIFCVLEALITLGSSASLLRMAPFFVPREWQQRSISIGLFLISGLFVGLNWYIWVTFATNGPYWRLLRNWGALQFEWLITILVVQTMFSLSVWIHLRRKQTKPEFRVCTTKNIMDTCLSLQVGAVVVFVIVYLISNKSRILRTDQAYLQTVSLMTAVLTTHTLWTLRIATHLSTILEGKPLPKIVILPSGRSDGKL